MPIYRSNFLKIEGPDMPGASTDSKHKKWIDIDSFSSSIVGEGNYEAQKQKTWRTSHSNMVVNKRLDATSPKLAQAASVGTPYSTVTIHVCRSSGKKETYMTYTMENVVIAAYRVGGESWSVPSETVEFRYEKITWTYNKSNATGSWAIPQHSSK